MERLNPVQTQDGGAYLPKGQQLLLQYLAKLRLLEALRNKKLEFILTLEERRGDHQNLKGTTPIPASAPSPVKAPTTCSRLLQEMTHSCLLPEAVCFSAYKEIIRFKK